MARVKAKSKAPSKATAAKRQARADAGVAKLNAQVAEMPAAMRRAVADRMRNDGWMNILTGLGDKSRDKRLGAQASWVPMYEVDAEQLYASDDVAAAFVDTLPEEALREWLTFTAGDDGEGDDSDDLAADVEAEMDRLGVRTKLGEAWTFGRLYGGGALFINVDDGGQTLDKPLDFTKVLSVLSLTALTRWELQITTQDVDLNLTSSRYGQPMFYRFHPRRGGAKMTGTRIHHSRILRFDGARLPIRLFISNGYWHDSVLNRGQNAIMNYNISHDAVAAVLQEFNQGVFKMKGLADMMAQPEGEGLVTKRLQVMQLARSVCRSIVVDSEDDFTNVGAALSGVDALVSKVEGRLTVASKMPHTKVLGDSPSGLGATGESENRDWYDFVANQRERELWHKVEYLIRLILIARKGPTGGNEPDNWSFEFNPLWQMDEAQLADVRKTQAETDQIYITANVVDPEEVASSRFGTGKWSPETTLDLEARAGAADQLDGGFPDPDQLHGGQLDGDKADPEADKLHGGVLHGEKPELHGGVLHGDVLHGSKAEPAKANDKFVTTLKEEPGV